MKRYNISLTAKGLYKKMQAEQINFDTAIQRGLVWDLSKKSLLIHSMIEDYPIPPMYLTKNVDGTFDSIDGKQRSNAIASYLNGDFVLEGVPVVHNDEGAEDDVNGCAFENLDSVYQDRIKDYSLLCYYFEEVTEDDVREIFRRLNNGKPLSAVELTRVKAVSIDKIQEIAHHAAVQMAVTEAGKNRFADETLAMQILGMRNMETPDFSTKVFRPWIQQFIIADNEVSEIKAGLDKLYQFMEDMAAGAADEDETIKKQSTRVLRRIKAKTHFVSMAYMLSTHPEVEQTRINEVLFDFFKGGPTTSSPDYNDTIGSGSAKADNVCRRKAAIDKLAETLGSIVPF